MIGWSRRNAEAEQRDRELRGQYAKWLATLSEEERTHVNNEALRRRKKDIRILTIFILVLTAMLITSMVWH